MTPPIDSRQLRAFVTLAHTGSFTVAAKELFLSQSAVSHSMKALEADLGCRLLDRVGKRVSLTQAGEQLLHHAEKIVAEMDSARASLLQLGKWGTPKLRIGASFTACQYIIPKVLRKLKERSPPCLISIEPGDTPNILEMLRNNRIDLAVSLMPTREEQVEFRSLFADELLFLVAPTHPWAVKRQVVRSEIPTQNYILYNKSSYTFRLVASYFERENMVLNTVIELGNMEATKELVKLGVGVSILAPWIARHELEEGSLVALPLGQRKLKRNWGVAFRRRHRLNLIEETFVTLCHSTAEEIISPGQKTTIP